MPEGGDNEGTVGYGTSVLGSAGGDAFQTTTTTTTSTYGYGAEAGAGDAGASYGVEGGDNEGTVGYGTSVLGSAGGDAFQTTTTTTTTSTYGFGGEAGAGDAGASFGVEGGDNEGTVGYGTSVMGSSSLPSVPSNPLASDLPYIGAAGELA